MPATGADPADPMAQTHSIGSPRTLNRSMMYGEGDGVTLRERHNLGASLHARALFRQNKFASSEVFSRFGE
jgi:hypothetical protein